MYACTIHVAMHAMHEYMNVVMLQAALRHGAVALTQAFMIGRPVLSLTASIGPHHKSRHPPEASCMGRWRNVYSLSCEFNASQLMRCSGPEPGAWHQHMAAPRQIFGHFIKLSLRLRAAKTPIKLQQLPTAIYVMEF